MIKKIPPIDVQYDFANEKAIVVSGIIKTIIIPDKSNDCSYRSKTTNGIFCFTEYFSNFENAIKGAVDYILGQSFWPM